MGKKRNAMDLDTNESDFLVSAGNARTWQAGGALYETDREHRNYCSRFIVAVMSAIIFLGGIALAVVGRVQNDKHIFSLCPKCDSIVLVMYIAGACIALVGVVGLMGAITRFKPIAFFFTAVIVLLALCTLAAGIAFSIYYGGLHQDDLKKLWTDAVEDDPELVCDLQDQLQCSGFDQCCNITYTGNGTAVETPEEEEQLQLRLRALMPAKLAALTRNLIGDETTTAAPSVAFPFPNACNITASEYRAQCSSMCTDTNDKYLTACNSKARSELRAHVAVILGCLYGATVVLVVTAVASVRMTLRS